MELEISYLQFHVLLLKSGAFIRKRQVGVVRCGFFFCCAANLRNDYWIICRLVLLFMLL